MTELQPGETLGGYRLERLLGEGAYARVFAATDLDGTVAVKVARETPVKGLPYTSPAVLTEGYRLATGAHLAWSKDPVAVLADEAAFLRAHAGPGLVGLIADHSRDAFPHLVLPFVAGESLQKRLNAEEGPALLLAVARHSRRLAEQGVGHGDLKPDNILVTDTGGVVLLDPAWPHQEHLGETPPHPLWQMPSALLTPSYNPFSADSDLPALGIMLIECLCGSNPFALPVPDQPTSSGLATLLAERQGKTDDRYARRIQALAAPQPEGYTMPARWDAIAMACLGFTRDEHGWLVPRAERYALSDCITDWEAALQP